MGSRPQVRAMSFGRVPPPRVRQQRVASQQRGSREELACTAHRASHRRTWQQRGSREHVLCTAHRARRPFSLGARVQAP